jgi:hypothetical protein
MGRRTQRDGVTSRIADGVFEMPICEASALEAATSGGLQRLRLRKIGMRDPAFARFAHLSKRRGQFGGAAQLALLPMLV